METKGQTLIDAFKALVGSNGQTGCDIFIMVFEKQPTIFLIGNILFLAFNDQVVYFRSPIMGQY